MQPVIAGKITDVKNLRVKWNDVPLTTDSKDPKAAGYLLMVAVLVRRTLKKVSCVWGMKMLKLSINV
jgi:hypothetical protein